MANADEQAFREAFTRGDAAAVAELVGRDPALAGLRDDQGVSFRLRALYERKREVADALVAADGLLDAFEAAALGRVEELRARLEEDPARANAYAPDGFTPLQLASFFGRPACVRELLSRGADPAAVSRNGMALTALHSAAAAPSLEAARALLGAGARADAVQHAGWTALHAAAMHGDLKLAELLVSHGADPRRRADNGQDAIALAREGGHAALADRLSGAR